MAAVMEQRGRGVSSRDILSPLGRPGNRQHHPLAPRPAKLASLAIGLLDNSKHRADVLLDEVGTVLLRDYGVRALLRWRKPTAAVSAGPILDEFIRDCDGVINAYGDCGSCTSWCVHDSVDLERRGIPVATVNTDEFVSLGRFEAQALGMPGLPIVTVPHPIGDLSEADVRSRARNIVAALVAALTTEAALLEATHGARIVTADELLSEGLTCAL